ncbi:hypothetical protein Clacol_002103 [Clathrus columnatus]|uniref:Cytochrome P450 n=1 Tax=Clathrus columnatus TaxID=1419009 RepID=A0AAV5A2P8_9AGAM|nr:hypothetical protein Clacol_002103 [Clathrus columnatus]
MLQLLYSSLTIFVVGDIISLNIFGIPVIIVYTDEIAKELFEKRGALYAERYPAYMAWFSGWQFNIALIQYGEWWRRHIRSFHQFFNSRVALSYEGLKIKECRQLLQNLLDTPDDFSEHLKFSIGRVIMDVVYAIDIKRDNDPFMNVVHTALEGFGYTLIPGLWLVDAFPVFKYLPDWIPGIPFKQFLQKYRQATVDTLNVPFDIVKNRANPDYSLVSTALERLSRLEEPLPNEELVIKNVAGTAYIAGASTTYAAALHAVTAAVLYPEIQKRIQDELDTVLGDRLPTLTDRKDLRYFNAFCWEILRWRPSAPIGVPRAVQEHDVYGDYFIPKGGMVIGDSWHVLRDKKYGPNPEDFNPERFFKPGVPPPTEHFGFGRRACPGRFFADNTIFLFMGCILKVFNIKPKKDENGNEIPVSSQIIESALPMPEPFECTFELRSPLAKELIVNRDDD